MARQTNIKLVFLQIPEILKRFWILQGAILNSLLKLLETYSVIHNTASIPIFLLFLVAHLRKTKCLASNTKKKTQMRVQIQIQKTEYKRIQAAWLFISLLHCPPVLHSASRNDR